MKRIMVRLDDDLYTRIFETAHDQRLSMNQFMVQAAKYALPLRIVIAEEAKIEALHQLIDGEISVPAADVRAILKG